MYCAYIFKNMSQCLTFVNLRVRNRSLASRFTHTRVLLQGLALPFDAVRAQYAQGVEAGFIERSMLAQRDFELALGSVERMTLGPWARRI